MRPLLEIGNAYPRFWIAAVRTSTTYMRQTSVLTLGAETYLLSICVLLRLRLPTKNTRSPQPRTTGSNRRPRMQTRMMITGVKADMSCY